MYRFQQGKLTNWIKGRILWLATILLLMSLCGLVAIVVILNESTTEESQEIHYIMLMAHNGSGVTLPRGLPVYISDMSGIMPNCDWARANDDSRTPVIGLVSADIVDGDDGWVVVQGLLDNLGNPNWLDGAPIYVQPDGRLDTIRPPGVSETQAIGRVAGPSTIMIDVSPEILRKD